MNLIILAGGKSSRFGSDKAFVKFGGISIIERILRSIGPIFDRTIIVANQPKSYERLNCQIVEDVHKEIGPLGGLHAGLTASDARLNFVVGCDMPLISAKLVRHMIGHDKWDAVVPIVRGFPEPLFSLYSKICVSVIEIMIKDKGYKISSLYDRVDTKYLPEEELIEFDPELRSFCNINTINALKEHERKNKNNQI